MEIYKRNIKRKVWLLRTTLALAVASIYGLIRFSHADYGLVLLFLFICGAIFPLTDLEVSRGLLEIRQFHIYGLASRTWTFHPTDKVRLEPFDVVMSDLGPAQTDDWYDAFLIFVPIKEVTVRIYVLRYQKASGGEGKIKLKLDLNEIQLIKTNMSVEQSLDASP
jgi:hypothetical protein